MTRRALFARLAGALAAVPLVGKAVANPHCKRCGRFTLVWMDSCPACAIFRPRIYFNLTPLKRDD